MSYTIVKTSEELFETDNVIIKGLIRTTDAFIVLKRDENKVDLDMVAELGKSLQYDGKIFIYEEFGERGAGGMEFLPDLCDTIFYSVAFIVTTSAAVFIKELTKDIYKNTLKKLFNAKKSDPNENGKFVIKLTTSIDIQITYYFPAFLSDDEFVDALIETKNHFEKIESGVIESKYSNYIYDRRDRAWLPL